MKEQALHNVRAAPGRETDGAQTLRLLIALVKREVEGRYRGSVLGVFWSMLTPLMMLGVYTFVFGTVFKSRWATSSSTSSQVEFAVILFVGLIVYQIFAETVNRAPGLMLANSNYVKKVVFPLEILVPVALGSALFHGMVSLAILFPFIYFVMGSVPWTTLLLPVIIFPLLLMTIGIGWFLASLGTYARDIGQFVGTITTAMMFLTPIFFPISVLPEWLHGWIALNPLTLPVEETREAVIFGRLPDFLALGQYTCLALIVFAFGFLWFQKTRKGFADVL